MPRLIKDIIDLTIIFIVGLLIFYTINYWGPNKNKDTKEREKINIIEPMPSMPSYQYIV